ncbi:MAG: glycosyltransferase [Cyanobacteria bacterium P01_C01_bin.120]
MKLHCSPQVAIFIRTLSGGGAERVMVNLANHWAEKGIKVDLVLVKVGGPYLDKVSETVNIVDLGCKNTKLLASIPKLVGYLRTYRPKSLLAALHYECEVAILARYLAGVKTRIVVSERNTLSVGGPRSREFSARLTPIAARITYPFADRIVAVSDSVAEDLSTVTHLPRQRIQTIYNPHLSLHILEKANESITHPWLSKDAQPVILAVGRLVEQKDYPTLLRAFALVKSQRDVRLIILGSGHLRKQLETLTKELGIAESVTFIGFVDNPYAYMSRAQMLVLASAWEGLPNVLIEALTVKIPIIATACPGGSSEILDHGKYGRLVAVGDFEAMAMAIKSVLDGENFANPVEWIQRKFSLESVANTYQASLGF